MGILDFLRSDEDKLKEKQSKFQEAEALTAQADSAYQDLKANAPWMVTPELEQTMEMLRLEREKTKSYLDQQSQTLAAGGGKPGLIESVRNIMPGAEGAAAYGEAMQDVGTAVGTSPLYEKGFKEPAMSLMAGLYGTFSRSMDILENWAKYISEKTGLPSGGTFGDLAEIYKQKSAEAAKEGIDPAEGGLAKAMNYIYTGIGGFAWDLPAIMALKLPSYSAIHGGGETIQYNKDIEEAKNIANEILAAPELYDEENVLWAQDVQKTDFKSVFWGTTIGGMHGLLLHGALKSGMKLPMPERALFGIGVFGTPTIADEMKKLPEKRDYPKIVADVLLGAGLMMGGGQAKTRAELRHNLKASLGEDFKPLVDRFKEMAEDKQLAAYAKERGILIADMMQTEKGRKFVEFMRPGETFEEARWRYMHERINERGVKYEQEIAAKKGRKIAEEEARQEAMAFKRRIIEQRIAKRGKAKEYEVKMAIQREQEIADREKRAEYENIYFKQLGKENDHMERLDDMAIELRQKQADFMTRMEGILKRAAVEKKTYEGPIPIITPGKPEFISEKLGVEKPTAEMIAESRKATAEADKINTIMERALAVKKRYEGKVPIIGEEGERAEKPVKIVAEKEEMVEREKVEKPAEGKKIKDVTDEEKIRIALENLKESFVYIENELRKEIESRSLSPRRKGIIREEGERAEKIPGDQEIIEKPASGVGRGEGKEIRREDIQQQPEKGRGGRPSGYAPEKEVKPPEPKKEVAKEEKKIEFTEKEKKHFEKIDTFKGKTGEESLTAKAHKLGEAARENFDLQREILEGKFDAKEISLKAKKLSPEDQKRYDATAISQFYREAEEAWKNEGSYKEMVEREKVEKPAEGKKIKDVTDEEKIRIALENLKESFVYIENELRKEIESRSLKPVKIVAEKEEMPELPVKTAMRFVEFAEARGYEVEKIAGPKEKVDAELSAKVKAEYDEYKKGYEVKEEKKTEQRKKFLKEKKQKVVEAPRSPEELFTKPIGKISNEELVEIHKELNVRRDPLSLNLRDQVYVELSNRGRKVAKIELKDEFDTSKFTESDWFYIGQNSATMELGHGKEAAKKERYAKAKEIDDLYKKMEKESIPDEKPPELKVDKDAKKYEELPVKSKGRTYVSDKVAKKEPDPESIHAVIRPKEPTVDILKKSLVKDGQMITTDLEIMIVSKTELADGLYSKIGKNLERDTTVDPKTAANEFPSVVKIEKPVIDVKMEIPFNDLERGMRFVADDILRENLQGVNFRFDVNGLEIVATNGHILTKNFIPAEDIKNYPSKFPEQGFLETTIRAPAIKALLKDRFNSTMRLQVGEKHSSIEQGDKTIYSRFLEGNYPIYNYVIPPEFTKGFLLDRQSLLDALVEMKPYTDKLTDHIGVFRTKEGFEIRNATLDPEDMPFKKVTIKAKELPGSNIPRSEFSLLMPVKGNENVESMDNFILSVDRGYLEQVVGGVKDKELTWFWNDAKGPQMLTGRTNATASAIPVKKESIRSGSGAGPDAMLSVARADEMLFTPKIKSDYTASDLNNPIRLRDIGRRLVTDINYEVGTDVRTGLIKRFKRKALGLFFPESGIIRVNNINDLSALSHEIGHYLDKHIFGFEERIKADPAFAQVTMAFGLKNIRARDKRLNRFRDKYGSELVDSLLERYELRQEMKALLSTLKYPTKKLSEAIAEFVHYYVIKPEIVQKTSPKFYNLFESILAEQGQFLKGLQRAREKFKEYHAQDARVKIESTIHRDSEENRLMNGIKTLEKGFFTNVIDGTAPFRELQIELLKKNPKLPGDKDPLLQVLSLIGAEGKAEQFFHFHPFLKEGNEIRILKDVRPLFGTRKNPGIIYDIIKNANLNEIEGYLVAKRNIELIERGMPDAATANKDVSAKAIEAYEKFYGKDYLEGLQNDLQKYQESVLRYYFESGKMSKENYEKVLDLNRYYIPFKRYFDEFETSGGSLRLSKFLRDYSPTPVKKIRGSAREVVSPIGSVIKNTYELITAADRNTALGSVVEGLQGVDKRLVQEIPAKIFRPVKVVPERIKSEVDEAGNTWISVKETGSELEQRIAVEYRKPKNAEIITVVKDGMPKYYQVPKRYYDAFFAINEPISKAIRMLSLPSRILQAGAVVYDPTFAVRNITRDQVSAWFYTRYGYAPWHFIRGVTDAIGKKDVYQKFLASGADQSFLTTIDKEMSKGYIEKKAGKRIQTKWQEYKRNPLLVAQDINRASELGTRVGAFHNAYRKTGDVYKAMQEGREIAGDYGVIGQAMRNIAPLSPFFNARIQHAKMIPQSLMRRRVNKTIAKAIPIVAGSMVNWYWNHRDEEIRKLYAELPSWRKIGMWNIHVPGTDSFVPIPRGPLGILFGSTTEYFLDHAENEDPETITTIANELWEDYSPIYIGTDLPRLATEISPQFGRPIIEQAMNKVGFTGRPIVPERYKSLDPADQYNIYTSEVFKKFGEITGLSPMRSQQFFVSYTAGAGRGLLSVTDEVLELAGISEKSSDDTFTRLSHLPITRALFTPAPLGTRGRSVQNFYKKLDEMESISGSINNYIKDDKMDRIINLLSDEEKNRAYKYYINPANKKAIGRFREILRIGKFYKERLAGMRSIKEGKRQMIRSMDESLTNIAIRFNNAYAKGKPFTIDDMMNEIHNWGIREKREETGLRRQFKGEARSSKQIEDVMKKLHLYRLREKAGVLKPPDYYRMKALENKLNLLNKQFDIQQQRTR